MTNPNDPAHPQHGWTKDPETLERMKNQGGLTKREYFAALAMQGLISDPQRNGDPAAYARDAVNFSDALIKELS